MGNKKEFEGIENATLKLVITNKYTQIRQKYKHMLINVTKILLKLVIKLIYIKTPT